MLASTNFLVLLYGTAGGQYSSRGQRWHVPIPFLSFTWHFTAERSQGLARIVAKYGKEAQQGENGRGQQRSRP